jgi:hypothetical protein
MMGLSKSPSFIPVARHKARAPAMLRPWVVVRERYWGIADSKLVAFDNPPLWRLPRDEGIAGSRGEHT